MYYNVTNSHSTHVLLSFPRIRSQDRTSESRAFFDRSLARIHFLMYLLFDRDLCRNVDSSSPISRPKIAPLSRRLSFTVRKRSLRRCQSLEGRARERFTQRLSSDCSEGGQKFR